MRWSDPPGTAGDGTAAEIRSARSRAVERGLRGVLFLAASALLLLATARLVAWTISQQVSFDGAMNLEVARSFAEGHGYRRLYADHDAFAHEIQTRAPFILPAAAVFAAFGVGIWQAQLVNLLYALVFAALVFVMVRRVAGPLWGVVATAAALAAPGIEAVGMNGYGELPALTWWLAGMLVLYGGDDRVGRYRRVLGAGILIGVAIVTKTVLLIGLVACLLPYIALLRSRSTAPVTTARSLSALAAGVALPLVIHETWHAIAMGGIRSWRHWMHDEIIAVHVQAGTHAALPGLSKTIVKAHAHFGILADAIGLDAVVLGAAMLGVAVLAFCTLRTFTLSSRRALIATLLIFAGIYFAWWLLMTPTQKAWYRRIFNGVIVFEIASVILAAQAWRLRAQIPASARAPVAVAGIALMLFQAEAWSLSLAPSKWPAADATADNAADAQTLARLPAGTHLYGVGWYSAPRVALYGGRRIDDVMQRTPAQLEADADAILVLDNDALTMKAGDEWLHRFDGRLMAQTGDFKLYRLDTSFKRPPFAGLAVDAAVLRDDVDFKRQDYAYLDGFHEREDVGWRWTRPQASILLHHGDEPDFTMDVYTLDDRSYATPGPLAIEVSIDGCRLGTWRQAPEGGNARLRMPLARCAVPAGQTVAVHLVADHVVEANSNRWLAYIVHAIGFADAAAKPR